MQVIGDGARHKLDLFPKKRAGDVGVIPTGVQSRVADRQGFGEGAGVAVFVGFKTKMPTEGGRVGNPIVTLFILSAFQSAQVEVSSPPKAVLFRNDGHVHEPFGDLRRGSVQPRYHQNPVFRPDCQRVGSRVNRIGTPAVQLQGVGECCQLAVHSRLVSPHFGRKFLHSFFLNGSVGLNSKRHSVTERQVADGGFFDLGNGFLRFFLRCVFELKPTSFPKNCRQRKLQLFLKDCAGDGFFVRQVQAKNPIFGNAAFGGVVLGNGF